MCKVHGIGHVEKPNSNTKTTCDFNNIQTCLLLANNYKGSETELPVSCLAVAQQIV